MDKPKLTSTVLLLLLIITECRGQPECGLAPLSIRIVGGQVASLGAWPWQVSLHLVGRHFCGGALINNQWVLSTAHCFFSSLPVTAFMGRQSQQGFNPNEVNRTVVEIIRHPDYNPMTNDNDLALLRLSSPVGFSNYIWPICLATSGSTFFTGTTSWMTGWGNIGFGVPLPPPENLMEIEVPVVGNHQCNCYYSGRNITDNMICAGVKEGGKDTCQGDSGGPMVSKQGSAWVLIGLVSFGMGCGQPEFPGVYTRVSRYQNWITSHVNIGNRPGFVNFMSVGTDPDLGFTCPSPVSTQSSRTPPPLPSTPIDTIPPPLSTAFQTPFSTESLSRPPPPPATPFEPPFSSESPPPTAESPTSRPPPPPATPFEPPFSSESPPSTAESPTSRPPPPPSTPFEPPFSSESPSPTSRPATPFQPPFSSESPPSTAESPTSQPPPPPSTPFQPPFSPTPIHNPSFNPPLS